tara:strand:- start:2629 stop:3045 length:417 start_codon:yes stop_codon:yes gene_type:complete
MAKKEYICKQCGDPCEGQRRKFCSDECGKEWNHDQHKMDFGTGNCHNDPVSYEQRYYTGSLETKSIPARVLQQIEDTGIFERDYHYTSYEDPDVVKIAIKSLNRNTPEHIQNFLYEQKKRTNYREKHGITREYPIPID